MASKRQLEANKLNARRSTGPKSELGKARTRLNAVKLGLTARDIVIGDEDPKEFETLRAELEADFESRTRIEYELVEQLAGLLWRLRRIPALEAAIARKRINEEQERLDVRDANLRKSAAGSSGKGRKPVVAATPHSGISIK